MWPRTFAIPGTETTTRPMYFVPEAQSATFEDRELQSREVWSHYPYNHCDLGARRSAEPCARSARPLTAVAPDLVVRRIDSYIDVVRRQFAGEHDCQPVGIFGAIGLALAVVGLYGLTEYRVERQKADIGVRMAPGGHPGSIVAMVLRRALTPVGAGIALGIPAAISAGLLMANQLFGVPRGIRRSYWSAPLLLLLVAATDCGRAIPARRAAAVDPLRALRTE